MENIIAVLQDDSISVAGARNKDKVTLKNYFNVDRKDRGECVYLQQHSLFKRIFEAVVQL